MQELHSDIASTLKKDIIKFNSLFDGGFKKEELKAKKKAEKKAIKKEKAKILGSIVKSKHMVG